MMFSFSEDDLILQLEDAAEHSLRGSPIDSTVARVLVEFDTLIQQLRQPLPDDPFDSEPELDDALARVLSIAETDPENVQPTPTNDPKSMFPKPLLGQYELLSQIGLGGMGTVYRARHTRLDRFVALKALPTGRFQSPDAIARFNREMRAVGRLHHPHIIAAQDAGEADGIHYLVMELVDGCDLGTVSKSTGKLSIADACEIARQAALGLQHLADHGLVHRDLKPSNMMLARSQLAGQPPIVKILDLGLAQFSLGETASDSEITQTGQVLGSIGFMAPEQGIDGTTRFDTRTDLYSLGATLFKLLTGRAPLEDPKHNTMLKRLQALASETPPLVSDLRPDCPAELSELVTRLLSKSPEDRPSKPEEVARALLPFTHGSDLSVLLRNQTETDVNVNSPLSKTIALSPTDSAHGKTNHVAKNTTPRKVRTRPLWLILLGLLGGASLLYAVIMLTTDQGTITIEAPDDLIETIQVSFLKEGAPTGTEFVVEPGTQTHRVRSGRVQIAWPKEVDDQFEITPKEEVLVRRGEKSIVRITRRSKVNNPAVVSKNSGPTDYAADHAAAEWILSVGGKVDIDLLPGGQTLEKLEDLPEIPFAVSSVSLVGCTFDNQDLAILAGLKSLGGFHAWDSNLDDTGLAALTDSGNNPPPNLSSANLMRTKLTDVGVAYLSKCKELQGLQLFDTHFRDARLLKPFSKLSYLTVNSCDLDTDSIASLRDLPNLTHLAINVSGWMQYLDDPDSVSIPLVSLQLFDSEGQFDATSLNRVPKLEQLYLFSRGEVIDDSFWNQISKMPRLQNLMVHSVVVNGVGLAPNLSRVEADLANLQKLQFTHCRITGDFLDQLFQKSPKLNELEIHWSDISNDAFEQLAKAANLKRFHYGGSNVDRHKVQALAAALPACEVLLNAKKVESQQSVDDQPNQ